MKFIYIFCECLIFIYIHVKENVEHKTCKTM